MKIRKYTDIRKAFKCGDVAWACEFNYSHDKDSKALYQKPIKGMLVSCNTESKNNMVIQECKDKSEEPSIGYFVPFKKNETELAWSKAVKSSSRKYASTEEECNELFNELINKAISWHESEIEALKSELIQ